VAAWAGLRQRPRRRIGLLDSWTGQLLRGGLQRDDTLRSPLDAALAAAGLLVAAVFALLVPDRAVLQWALPWSWLGVALQLTVLVAVGGAALLVAVLAARTRRWVHSVPAATAAAAALGLSVAAAAGSDLAAAAWTVLIAAGTAVWPVCLTALKRSLLVGMVAATLLLLSAPTHEPAVELVALAGLGVAIAGGWRLVVGRDVARTYPQEAAELAGELGVAVTGVRLLDRGRQGVADRFVATGPAGPVEITVYGRSSVDTHLLNRLVRFAWYRNARLPVPLTRLQHLEHHVALTLQGRDHGACRARVVAAGLAGPASDAVVVTTAAEQRTLAGLTPAELGPSELDAVWHAVLGLCDAGITHGGLSPRTLALADKHCVIGDLAGGSLLGSDDGAAADRAACLVSTASVAGVPEAVAAAHRALAGEGLAELAPLLQNAALPPEIRVARGSTLLTELRAAVADSTRTDAAELAVIRRVNVASLVMAAGTLLGIWLLIGQLTGLPDVGQQLLSATWWWIALALAVVLLTNLTEAVALSGAVSSPLPFWPLVMLRVSNGFFGLVGGTVATTAAAVRFFQRAGLNASVAVSSGILYSLSGFVDQMVLSLVALVCAAGAFSWSGLDESTSGDASDPGSLLLILVVVVLIVAGIVVGLLAARPHWRHMVSDRVKPQLAVGWDNLRDLARQPGKLRRLFGANVLTQLLFATGLGLCLHAYGGSTSIGVLILVNTAASLLGGLAPIPGGMGVMEAALISGLLAAGIPDSQAVPAVFSYRLLTSYLPPLWGWPAMMWLRRRDYL
jgi:uncharacterized membrane protein YbhN (UPF0104 family)